MASACANPILYGFLNENFKKEFKGMFQTISHNVFVRSETSLETTTEFWNIRKGSIQVFILPYTPMKLHTLANLPQ